MHVDSRGSGRDAVWFIVDRYTKKEHELVEFRAKFCRETVRNPSGPLSPSRFPPACSSRPPPFSSSFFDASGLRFQFPPLFSPPLFCFFALRKYALANPES